jgi:hypothetical protein
MRRAIGIGTALIAGGLILAACGSTATTTQSVTGDPSLAISVPLQVAACEPTGPCYALGTTGLDSDPTSAAQATIDGKSWSNVSTPRAPSTIVTSASCWSGGCLVGGSSAHGDVVWRNSSNTSMIATNTPNYGLGISAISCYAAKSCAVVDSTSDGTVRVTYTTDGGSTWSSSQAVGPLNGASATSISCIDHDHCVIGHGSSSDSSVGAGWTATSDGFATTTSGHEFPNGDAWLQLNDLTCNSARCVGRVSDSSGAAEVVVADLKGQWFATAPTWTTPSGLPTTLDAVSCSPTLRCVAVGSHGGQGALYEATSSGWNPVSLNYVSDALTGAACGSTRCEAINGWTVASLTLN